MIIRDFELDVAYMANNEGYNMSQLEIYLSFRMAFNYHLQQAHLDAIAHGVKS